MMETISARVEQLAHEVEQHPDCVKSKEQMRALRTKAKQLMGEDDAEHRGKGRAQGSEKSSRARIFLKL